MTVVAAGTALLEFEHVTKDYPGVRALDDVSLSVERGEVMALLGENGAGKSTLMKILGGAEHRDSGVIRIDGNEAPQHTIPSKRVISGSRRSTRSSASYPISRSPRTST